MPVMEDHTDAMPEHEIVRVVNNGPEPFTGKWAGRKFTIEPGGQKMVPYYAMCLWAGHPQARDISKQEKYRTDELQRLQTRYGTYAFGGCWTTKTCDGYPRPDDGKRRHPPMRHLPDIHFYSIDTDHEYNTVLIDPEGVKFDHDVLANDAIENDAIKMLRDEVQKLQEELAIIRHNSGAPDAPMPVRDVDIPPSAPGVQGEARGAFDTPEPVGAGGGGPVPKKRS